MKTIKFPLGLKFLFAYYLFLGVSLLCIRCGLVSDNIILQMHAARMAVRPYLPFMTGVLIATIVLGLVGFIMEIRQCKTSKIRNEI